MFFFPNAGKMTYKGRDFLVVDSANPTTNNRSSIEEAAVREYPVTLTDKQFFLWQIFGLAVWLWEPSGVPGTDKWVPIERFEDLMDLKFPDPE